MRTNEQLAEDAARLDRFERRQAMSEANRAMLGLSDDNPTRQELKRWRAALWAADARKAPQGG